MNELPTEDLVRNIVKCVLYILAILLNTLLLVVLWRDPLKRFRNSPSYTIANIAFADIMASIGGLANTAVIVTCSGNCVKTYTMFGCMQTTGLQGSFVFITLLAFDRFLAISHPYKYTRLLSGKHRYIVVYTIAWAISTALSILVYYVELDQEKVPRFFVIALYIADMALLAVITAALYPLNYYNYLRRKQLLTAGTNTVQCRDDLRLAQQLNISWVVTSTALFIFMVPYLCLFVYYVKNCWECLLNVTFLNFWKNYQAIVWPAVSLIYPIIYAWRLPLYRKSSIAVGKSFLKMFRATKETGIPGSTDTLTSINNSSRLRVSSNSTPALQEVHVSLSKERDRARIRGQPQIEQ